MLRRISKLVGLERRGLEISIQEPIVPQVPQLDNVGEIRFINSLNDGNNDNLVGAVNTISHRFKPGIDDVFYGRGSLSGVSRQAEMDYERFCSPCHRPG